MPRKPKDDLNSDEGKALFTHLMGLIALLPDDKREEGLLLVLEPFIQATPTSNLSNMIDEIKNSDLPQDHPYVVSTLELIEGQLALRSMRKRVKKPKSSK